MRDSTTTSLSLGRLVGLPLRLHGSFIVCVLAAVYFAGRTDNGGFGLLAGIVWLASLYIHQLAHLLAAARLGGHIDRVFLTPLGDLVPVSLPQEPRRELVAALAGPIAHAIVLLVVCPAILVSGEDLRELMLSPFGPSHLVTGGFWLALLKLIFWINWLMLLVNLLPALPLDGGRALAAGLQRPMGDRRGSLIVAQYGTLVTIVGLTLWGFFASPTGPDLAIVPAWLPLSVLSLYLFFVARYEFARGEDDDRDGDLLGYDFSQGYTSLERGQEHALRREPGPLRRWLEQRREQKLRRAREIEIEEERRVDEILARVKDVGMEAITPEERALLNRVAIRYRNRQSHT